MRKYETADKPRTEQQLTAISQLEPLNKIGEKPANVPLTGSIRRKCLS